MPTPLQRALIELARELKPTPAEWRRLYALADRVGQIERERNALANLYPDAPVPPDTDTTPEV